MPVEAGVSARWSAHPVGSEDYYTFSFKGPRLVVEGQGLDSLQTLLSDSGLVQVPPEQIARAAEDVFAFTAAAAWESEGCLFSAQGGEGTKSFKIDLALLAQGPLVGIADAVGEILPVSEEEPKETRLELAPDALLESLNCVAIADTGVFMKRELSACATALKEWLLRRKRDGDVLIATYYEDE